MIAARPVTPLLDVLAGLLGTSRAAFPRQKSFLRAISHALALSAVLGRRNITRAIWNTEYKLFSRCPFRTRLDCVKLTGIPRAGQFCSR